jgi:zinc protease
MWWTIGSTKETVPARSKPTPWLAGIVVAALGVLTRVPFGVAQEVTATEPLHTSFEHTAERYTLDNGLSVVLDPMPNLGSVAIAIVYRVGARDQQPGYTGLAHLTEHMMFEGSEHARGHFLDALDAMGATERNGMTERDRTTYYEVVPSEQLERALFLEADRMAFLLPALEESRIANQRAVVLRERSERVDLGGLGIIPGLLASVLYPAPHPYAELGEHRDDVEALRYEHIAWFIQTWYAPDNATLAVVGDFEPERARIAIERWFGPIRRSGERPQTTPMPTITQLDAERRLVVEAPVHRDELVVVWPTPAWGNPGDAELDLIAMELEGRLERRLVDTGRATAVDVRQGSYDMASEFLVSITTSRGQGTLEALEALDAELEELRTTPPSPTRVATLQRRMILRKIEALESPVFRATQLAIRSTTGWEWSFAWQRNRYLALDGAALQRSLNDWLPSDRRLVLSLAAVRDAPIEGRVAVDITIPVGAPRP